ncbi:dynein light chain Tctex-type 5-like [Spea bombifrons]|uniref:dynein light chain Tctex-type 5-like n=1 Tax=Spea bombifrons TaxID=233779 RepID=UPI00234A8B8F|nr:dynein light chain Tctex-type 5-like [Spea bombifrons]
MDPSQDLEPRRWIHPNKPKTHQRRSEWESSLSINQQQSNDSGKKRKTITQDNPKVRSRLATEPMSKHSFIPETDLQPQPKKCFSAEEASRVIKSVLDQELQDSRYDAANSHRRALQLADLVKSAVRELGYERYKLVCYVVLGPVSPRAMCCCSRSVWSPNSDTYAEYLFQNHSLFALCVVYAGYCE